MSLWLSNYLLPATVTDTYTYNGAGIGSVFSSAVTAALGAITGNPTTFVPSNNATNLYAYGDIAVIAGVGGSVGQNIPVNIEYKTLLSDPIDYAVRFYNHSIVQLTDAIAVVNLLNKLDSSVTTSKFNDIFDKGSNKIGESLEGMLDSLRKLFGMTDTTPNDNRTTFYDNLYNLQNSATYQALIGKVTVVASPTTVSEARDDFGSFLSLYYLTPFALKTDGSAAAIAALGAIHPDLEDKWQEDNALTPEQIANGEANFSDMYLADRAAMLSWISKLNEEDFVDPNNGLGYQSSQVQGLHFEDKTSNQVIDINKILSNKQHIIFGENIGPINADTLTGGLKNDHLYGMGGNDTVSGGEGDDHLEGNAGNDELNGEKGKDVLLGGDGSDTLTGGKDRDMLYGGEGVDTYVHNQGDGSDVIMDTSGIIQAKYQGVDLTVNGGKRVDQTSNYWLSEDKKIGYTKYTAPDGKITLNILLPGGEKLYIPDWQAGAFGINLEGPDEEQPPTPPVALSNGDEYLFSTVDYSTVDGMGGNDVLFGTANNDRILGGVGNDIIGGFVGDDVLEGGDGNDWLEGGVGEVKLYGGSGDDFLTTAESFYESTPEGYVEVNGSYRVYKKNESGIYESFGADDPEVPGDYDRWEGISSMWRSKNVRQEGDDGLYFFTEFLNTYGTDVDVEAKLTFTDTNYEFRASYYQFVDDEKGDFFYGGAGNDTILGSMNSDYIEGGSDDDVIAAGFGADYIDGGVGNDLIAGHHGDDLIDAGDGNDRVYAGYDSDVIFGGAGNDEIIADIPQLNEQFVAGTAFDLMGNDTAYGGAGLDMLYGQGGDDTLFGGADNDYIRGDDKGLDGAYHGSDYLVGDEGDDVIYGDGGADTLKGGLGADKLYGDVNDRQSLGGQFHGNDQLDGGEGNDQLIGGGGNDKLLGGEGNDTLLGDNEVSKLDEVYHGNDTLDGGNGDDILDGNGGDDTLNGGAGNDQLVGGKGNDTLNGGTGSDGLWGNEGNDTLVGTGGIKDANGVFNGGDALFGGAGNDIYFAQAGDVISDTEGNNTINASVGYTDLQLIGSDLAIGTSNGDYIFLLNALSSNGGNVFKFGETTINLSDLVGTGMSQSVNWTTNTQYAVGGNLNDTLSAGTVLDTTIFGGDGSDVINGNGGNDTINGGEGNDQIFGGDGNDFLKGGIGNDTLDGGAGTNTYQFNLGDGQDRIVLNPNHFSNEAYGEIISLGAGITPNNITIGKTDSYGTSNVLSISVQGTSDSLYIQNYFIYDRSGNIPQHGVNNHVIRFSDGTIWTVNDVLNLFPPTTGNDKIDGRSSADIIHGLSGDDAIYGQQGNDQLYGDEGNDTLFGSTGNDLLDGGIGNDRLIGGFGSDVYVFERGHGQDVIYDIDLVQNGIKADYVQLGANIAPSDVVLNVNASNTSLLIKIAGTNDQLEVQDYFTNNGIEDFTIHHISFSDGTIWNKQDILNKILNPTNSADNLVGFDADDNISGLAGDDYIYGNNGNDHLEGGLGDDWLDGGKGNDTLDGGSGNDLVYGYEGSNQYIFGRGYGQDEIRNSGVSDFINKDFIYLKADVNPADVRLGRVTSNNSLIISINGTADILKVEHYFSTDPYYQTIKKISGIVFSDGTVWDTNQILQLVTDMPLIDEDSVVGTEGADLIKSNGFVFGMNGNDIIIGGVSNDELHGGQGLDTLLGGKGLDKLYGDEGNDLLFAGLDTANVNQITDDYLTGGLGSDTYQFGYGSGTEVIIDSNGDDLELNKIDTIQFLSGITPDKVEIKRIGDDLVLSLKNTNDLLTVSNFFYTTDISSQNRINQILFDDGYVMSADSIKASVLLGTDNDDYISGYDSNDTISGQLGNDVLYGYGGDDVIDGGANQDEMYGGVGDDTYFVDNVNDIVQENLNEGTDTVLSAVTYTLASNFENLTLTGNAAINGTGNTLDNTIIGNEAVNTLNGGSGNDFLDGGLGADSLIGGPGNDTYVVDNAGDLVTEAASAGTDTVQSSISYTLGTNLENLTLTGSANIDGVGNSVANIITGNAGNNLLNGLAGNDIMAGGLGNDTYTIDAIGDVVTEAANAGTDTVNVAIATASGTYTVAANVENAALINTVAYNLTGNALDNTLIGNAAVNTLTGGDGNDTLNGAGGNDILMGGLGDDIYDYYAGQGNDQIDNTATDNATAIDKLYLRDISAASVALSRATSDLVVTINGSATVTVKNYFAAGDSKIDQIVFSDGTSWNQADIQSRIPSVPTTGDDVLTGTSGNDTIDALAGNDTVSGGDGDDQLLGNTGNDTLYGEVGNDNLNGGAGNDTMVGGLGNDTYTIDATTDIITENLNEGTDIVNVAIATASGTYTLAANVENATLTNTVAYTLTGNALDNVLTGNAAANTLNGGDGNDTLNGLAGNDTMVGGLGNDIYTIDSTSDVVTEAASAGTDTVNVAIATASGTYTLAANVENATLTNTVAYNLTGNALSNVLTGNAQANNLNGGAGADTMIGGAGNDTYTIDATGDVITENLNEGTDLVNVAIATASGSYTMAANVENATLTNTVAFTLTGNALDNVLTGNAAANTLNGGDGNDTLNGLAGNDTMVGGLGNDTYTIDATGDVVTEAAGAGTDLVNVAIATASGTYTLAANVENATLTNTVAFTLTGNALDNVLTGNAAANTLNGGDGNDTLNGLAGNDTMVGGLGNDTYTIDATGDVVTEAASGGTDTVNVNIATASGTYTLAANIENAILINTVAYNLTGNALANYMRGNSANNTLTDSAGGNDTLQGLAGIDTFNDTVGNNLFDGGVGNDIITAGSGRDLLIGGVGNDTITTGTGYDVISFNKGDGADIINASTGADNTISLGGNFAYSDLSLTKATNDLIIKMGATDQITLKDWYASGATNKSVVNLQVIAEAMQGFSLGGADVLRNNKVETFNFTNLVDAFDAAGATANWQLTDARLTAHLQAGSDTAAIGGDLAYQYGKNSNLTGMGLLNAQSVISNASFGQVAQTLNNPSVWQAELVKMA